MSYIRRSRVTWFGLSTHQYHMKKRSSLSFYSLYIPFQWYSSSSPSFPHTIIGKVRIRLRQRFRVSYLSTSFSASSSPLLQWLLTDEFSSNHLYLSILFHRVSPHLLYALGKLPGYPASVVANRFIFLKILFKKLYFLCSESALYDIINPQFFLIYFS